ncbi:hypothetical protein DFH07DRAFT_947159 [Mycena maculata]|uniref:Uncharacterized protein n=1 Tax=Mycena maculata TaxID=230809 RepID=A0AAD7HFF8_9AGAR|nr:hypothetical protein DFH07DRAFT_947159 [Mycena maculata]
MSLSCPLKLLLPLNPAQSIQGCVIHPLDQILEDSRKIQAVISSVSSLVLPQTAAAFCRPTQAHPPGFSSLTRSVPRQGRKQLEQAVDPAFIPIQVVYMGISPPRIVHRITQVHNISTSPLVSHFSTLMHSGPHLRNEIQAKAAYTAFDLR